MLLAVSNHSSPWPVFAALTGCRVPSIIAGAITISLLGFFSGPFFATVSILSRTPFEAELTDLTGNICWLQALPRTRQVVCDMYAFPFQALSMAATDSIAALVFVVGQVGGSIFPAITGVIAARAGVRVLQPMLVGLIGATGVSWLILPRTGLHRD